MCYISCLCKRVFMSRPTPPLNPVHPSASPSCFLRFSARCVHTPVPSPSNFPAVTLLLLPYLIPSPLLAPIPSKLLRCPLCLDHLHRPPNQPAGAKPPAGAPAVPPPPPPATGDAPAPMPPPGTVGAGVANPPPPAVGLATVGGAPMAATAPPVAGLATGGGAPPPPPMVGAGGGEATPPPPPPVGGGAGAATSPPGGAGGGAPAPGVIAGGGAPTPGVAVGARVAGVALKTPDSGCGTVTAVGMLEAL